MRIDGQLKRAAVETLGADPSTSADKFTGRLWYNTATDLFKGTTAAGTVKTFVDTDTAQLFTNKSFSDSTTYFKDESDATKIFQFQASGISTGTTRTYTVPNFDGTLATLAGTETFTNKTLTGNTIVSFLGGSGATITAPSTSGTLATLANAETFTNKSLSDSTTYFIDESDGTKKFQFQASGITTATTRTYTVPNFDGTLATLAGTETFTNKTLTGNTIVSFLGGSGATITSPSTSGTLATLANAETFTNKSLSDSTTYFIDESDGTKKFQFQASGISTSTTRVYTVPNFDGTLATLAGTETFTNKTLTGNTIVSFLGGSGATITSPSATGTLATLAGTETFTNKSFSDSTCLFVDNGDATKKLAFELSGITTATTRTVTIPDSSGTIFYANTLTTKGDIFAATAATTVARLGVGSNGQFLKADSTQATGLIWASVSTALTVTAKTIDYTALTTDDVVTYDTSGAARTLTLYTAVGNTGKKLTIVMVGTGTNPLTVDGNASETIAGKTTVELRAQYNFLTIISDGANWQVVEQNVREVVKTTVTSSADQASPSATTWYIPSTSFAVTLRAGTWKITVNGMAQCRMSSSTRAEQSFSLGTSSTPGTNLIGNIVALGTHYYVVAEVPGWFPFTHVSDPLVLSSASQTVYLNTKYVNFSGTPTITNLGWFADANSVFMITAERVDL